MALKNNQQRRWHGDSKQYIGDYAHSFMTDAPRCPRCGSREIRPYIQDPDAEDQ